MQSKVLKFNKDLRIEYWKLFAIFMLKSSKTLLNEAFSL